MIEEKDIEQVKSEIEAGNVYAEVVSVAKSGMSRRIRFFVVRDNAIVNITPIIHGDYNQGGKNVCWEGMRVDGCGMDMIMHTLYSFLEYERAKNWSQSYHTL